MSTFLGSRPWLKLGLGGLAAVVLIVFGIIGSYNRPLPERLAGTWVLTSGDPYPPGFTFQHTTAGGGKFIADINHGHNLFYGTWEVRKDWILATLTEAPWQYRAHFWLSGLDLPQTFKFQIRELTATTLVLDEDGTDIPADYIHYRRP